jgi:hypothetical protein
MRIALRLEMACKQCNASFARRRVNGRLEDATLFRRRKYCSKECSALGQRKESPSRSALLKRIASMRKPSCERCGGSESLTNHHKDRDWKNNDPSNLMTLCSSCHTSLHHEAGDISPRRAPVPCRVCGGASSRRDLCGKHLQRFKTYGDPLLTKRKVNGSWTLVSERS